MVVCSSVICLLSSSLCSRRPLMRSYISTTLLSSCRANSWALAVFYCSSTMASCCCCCWFSKFTISLSSLLLRVCYPSNTLRVYSFCAASLSFSSTNWWMLSLCCSSSFWVFLISYRNSSFSSAITSCWFRSERSLSLLAECVSVSSAGRGKGGLGSGYCCLRAW